MAKRKANNVLGNWFKQMRRIRGLSQVERHVRLKVPPFAGMDSGKHKNTL